MTDGMEIEAKDAFEKRVSPDFINRIKGEFAEDPLQIACNRLDFMASGMDVMLEASLMVNAHSMGTELSVIKDQFLKYTNDLDGLIRENNVTAAKQRLVDIVQSFYSYKKVTESLFARLTQIIETFPKYSAELNGVSAEIQRVRFEIMEENVVVLGEDEIKKLAVELYSVLVSIQRGDGEDDVVEVDESVEETMEKKKTVADKLDSGGE